MRIALFSDVHANLPALEAVLDDIKQKELDAVYCLGDLVGYAPWPNEVIAMIREQHIPTIAGNYDYGVGRNSDDCGCAYKTDEDKRWGAKSIGYTNEIISPQNRAYLKSLPAHLRIEIGYEPSIESFLFVHGSPRKINEYLFVDRPEKSFKRMMSNTNARLMAFGHTHKPYHKILEDSNGYRHAINIGSVGKPKDGDPRACYTILEWDEFDVDDPETISVKFVRIGYEVEKAASAVEESPLPDAFADMLRKAY
jgi:predicted phosphodiesterase